MPARQSDGVCPQSGSCLQADDRIRGEHAAYYLKSASSVFFATEKAPLPELPPQLGELYGNFGILY